MRRIRSHSTKPEMIVRKLVFGMGYRYRLHVNGLPGRPDIVFRRRKAVIFVHGCFWHQHDACGSRRIPKSNKDYWQPKLERNVQRDERNFAELARLGWRLLVIWECELSNVDRLKTELGRFLGDVTNPHDK